MKNIRHITLALALCLLIVVFLPLKADAATIDSGSCGDNVTWTVSDSGVLTISGTGPMYDFDYYTPWDAHIGRINQVVINYGVTSIGSDAFCYMEMTSVSIPSTVTSIGEYAFYSCPYLTTITLPAQLKTIGHYAFSMCDLSTITIPATVNEIGVGVFVGNVNMTKITVLGGNGSYCSVNDVLFNAAKTDLIHFPAKKNVTSYTIPNTVTSLSNGAFSYNSNLTSVTLPESLTHIGYQAFFFNGGLTSLHIPKSVIEIGDYALSCMLSLETISVAAGNPEFEVVNNVLYILGQGDLVMYPIGNTAFSFTLPDQTGCVRIGAFALNPHLNEITFGSEFGWIKEEAFAGCENLHTMKFTGPVPRFGGNCFAGVTATAYYPEGFNWDPYNLGSYGGNITWVSDHVHDFLPTRVVEPTCVDYGFTEYTCRCGMQTSGDITNPRHTYSDGFIEDDDPYTHSGACIVCGQIAVDSCTFTDSVVQEATLSVPGILRATCTVCGDYFDTNFPCRIFGANRYETAFSAADMLKEQLGVDKFSTIIVASGLDFADALTGSYLAAVKSAPILLVNQHFMDEAAAYINENLAVGGRVYLLGGELAVLPAMEEMLSGLDVVRLAGANRLETNLLILNEAGVGDEEILVCYSHGFADSLSASAVGKPILMVNRGLTPAQKEFLAAADRRFVIIGGESAVSADIEALLQQYGTTERIGGSNRYETSINVAKRFFENPEAVVLAYGANFPDGLCGGPLAYSVGAPLILTRDVNARMAAAYTAEFGISNGSVLGGTGLISDESVNTILAR